MIRGGRAAPIVEKYGLDPTLARILAGRLGDNAVEEFLDRQGPLFDPSCLKDADGASMMLIRDLSKGGSVCIVGDYDVDGVTATAILYLGLSRMFPSAQVGFRIPERMSEGYGISLSIAEEIADHGFTHVITCDNGIAAPEPIEWMKDRGIRVIVTDHHEIPYSDQKEEILPGADYVIDPHRKGDLSPQKEICGAFVALQLVRLIYRQFFLNASEPEWMKLLYGYAALGTICDVMPLTGQNRRLAYQGIRILNERPSVGIRCLMNVAEVGILDPVTIGFRIGPMLNAGGRLGSQNKYVHILLSRDETQCFQIARELMNANRLRQDMTEKGVEEGIRQLKSADSEDLVKVIYLPDLHESIAGLVAGKIKEQIYRPVLVLTKGEEGLKGSARSIESYMMVDELAKVRDHFTKMGGHAMAAGFSLDAKEGEEEKVVDRLRKALNERCVLSEDDLIPTVWIDAQLQPSAVTLPLIDRLELLAPFGVKNPKPQLASRGLSLLRARIRGAKGNVISLLLHDEGGVLDAVCFEKAMIDELIREAEDPESLMEEMEHGIYFSTPIPVDIVYEASIDRYYGSPRVKIQVKHIRYSQMKPNLV
ncbi:MAG: DHH family phosphoesterase [Firmicutes bacterium]|nr:DHH family phosphoesterase [Bacillota bacterium]